MAWCARICVLFRVRLAVRPRRVRLRLADSAALVPALEVIALVVDDPPPLLVPLLVGLDHELVAARAGRHAHQLEELLRVIWHRLVPPLPRVHKVVDRACLRKMPDELAHRPRYRPRRERDGPLARGVDLEREEQVKWAHVIDDPLLVLELELVGVLLRPGHHLAQLLQRRHLQRLLNAALEAVDEVVLGRRERVIEELLERVVHLALTVADHGLLRRLPPRRAARTALAERIRGRRDEAAVSLLSARGRLCGGGRLVCARREHALDRPHADQALP
mmetsp:Transcript_8162/g.25807  ORF Transcript_8162/g.25807 Transcript_8162/m.25807 type:complete len:276 (-) Transcript_8162:57-884(-)